MAGYAFAIGGLPCANLAHRAIAPPDLEAAIRALRLNRRKICRTMSASENPVRRSDAKPMRPAKGDNRCV
jgi:hypothetical protein